jgi:hypothetical protein
MIATASITSDATPQLSDLDFSVDIKIEWEGRRSRKSRPLVWVYATANWHTREAPQKDYFSVCLTVYADDCFLKQRDMFFVELAAERLQERLTTMGLWKDEMEKEFKIAVEAWEETYTDE